MRYEQIAPPHFACGVPEEGITEEVVPHVGWLNALVRLVKKTTCLHADRVAECPMPSLTSSSISMVRDLSSRVLDTTTRYASNQATPYGRADISPTIELGRPALLQRVRQLLVLGARSCRPYSVVWFDTETANDGEMFSGYVARDGVILSSSCEEGSAFVRPWGGEDTYPPPSGLDHPAGYVSTPRPDLPLDDNR